MSVNIPIMKVVLIYGAPGVGKMTTANELSKLTSFPVLHNHLTIDVVLPFFEFGSKPFNLLLQKLRTIIVGDLIKNNIQGLILTSGFPNQKDVRNYYKKLEKKILSGQGSFFYVKLICSQSEQEKRVVNLERKKFNKVNNASDLRNILKKSDFSFIVKGKKSLLIDNTFIEPNEVANQIMKFISQNQI